MDHPILVCPDCGEINEVSEPFCTNCSSPLDSVAPMEERDLNPLLQLMPRTSYKLVRLDLVSNQLMADEYPLPDGDGEWVVGRSSGSFRPDIDLKPWSIPYISDSDSDPLKGQRQRGISRTHAVLVRAGNELFIYSHPDSNPDLPVKVGQSVVSGTSAADAQPLTEGQTVSLGDIFAPGSKKRAPGVIFQVVAVGN